MVKNYHILSFKTFLNNIFNQLLLIFCICNISYFTYMDSYIGGSCDERYQREDFIKN